MTSEVLERPNMLTAAEASKYLGIPRSTLDTWRCRGRPDGPVPAFLKLSSRMVRYFKEDLDTFLDKCRHETTVQRAR